MKDLEVQTYNLAVEGIGFVKSIEKEQPELATEELKHSVGAVSLKFMDALSATENEDFASNLRACNASLIKSTQLLNELKGLNDNLNLQKEKLLEDSRTVQDKLDHIISKLIY